MIVIAAVVAAAVTAVFLLQSTRIGQEAAYAVCKFITLGQGNCDSPTGSTGAQQKDRTPSDPCVVSNNSVSTNREIAVVIVTAKDGRAFEVSTLSDGTYRVTRVTSGGVGVEAGVGAGVTVTVDDKRYGGTVAADAGAGLEFTAGEVYYAKDPAELKQLVDEELEDTVEDGVLGDSGPGRWLWERGQDVAGTVTGNPDYEFGVPDEVYAEGGVVVNASAEATSLATSGAAALAESEGLGVRTTKDGKTTVYLKTTADGEADLQMLGIDTSGIDFSGGGGSGHLELLTAVTFDSKGNMIEVGTTATAGGESSGAVAALFNGNADYSLSNQAAGTTVYSATLPTGNDSDRNTALAFLAASGASQLGGPQVKLAAAVPGALAMSAFRTAAADHGTVTQQHLTSESSTPFAVDAAGKIEVELGLSADVSTKKMISNGGEYWDGSAWQTWEGCAA